MIVCNATDHCARNDTVEGFRPLKRFEELAVHTSLTQTCFEKTCCWPTPDVLRATLQHRRDTKLLGCMEQQFLRSRDCASSGETCRPKRDTCETSYLHRNVSPMTQRQGRVSRGCIYSKAHTFWGVVTKISVEPLWNVLTYVHAQITGPPRRDVVLLYIGANSVDALTYVHAQITGPPRTRRSYVVLV